MISLAAGKDLQLKELRDYHADDLFQLIESNRPRLKEFLAWLDTHTKIEDTQKFVRVCRDINRRGLALSLGIFYQDKLAGHISFNRIDQENKAAFIGYWLAKNFEAQGLVTQSVTALIRYGFQELHLHRMELRCAPENERSRKVALRLGFQYEGRLRDAEWLYDHFVDHEIYSLLAHEWMKVQSYH